MFYFNQNPNYCCTEFRVHDTQAYKNMEMTRERISFTFDLRDMSLSFQNGFSFVRATVTCAIFWENLSFKLLSETIAPRYLKLVTVPSLLLSFHLDLPLNAIGAVCHYFGLLSTHLHHRLRAGFVESR